MKRLRNTDYLKWVASLPCCACGLESDVVAHHFKSRGMMSGTALKAPDQWVMPLCPACHTRFHSGDKAMMKQQFEWVSKTLALFFEKMAGGLGPKAMKTMIKGIEGME